MQISVPEQFRVSDFLGWNRDKRLVLNPDFQRGPVWTLDIRSYFINSLLRGFPTPKIFLRSRVDIVSQQVVREVIDGQQRIRALIDFANGELRLNRRGGEFAGFKYDDLDDELKSDFLSYSISVEQLINAPNDVVLEIFARFNTYSVPLNAAELRNAKYNGDFKFAIISLAIKLNWFWEKYGVFSVRQRVRMLDDEFTAELFGVLIDGIKNGGKPYIDRLYARLDGQFPQGEELTARIEELCRFIDTNLSDALEGEFFSRAPQFLILFAAVAHKLYGIPDGDIEPGLPERGATRIDPDRSNANLTRLTLAVASDSPPDRYSEFALAARGATTRVPSRSVRFRYVWQAISDES